MANMPRAANGTDFWRGFALITIYINHVPGLYYSRFTHREFGLSDSAELFVFLAGAGLAYSVQRHSRSGSPATMLWALSRRSLVIYIAQILIISIAVALLAAASIVLDNPLIVTWHNAEAVFYDPVRANIGLVLLTHQLGYFNILPLYVVLTILAPAIALTDRWAPRILLPASLALYLAVLVFEINLPTWPVAGEWFFNPLAWQFIFVLGFLLTKPDGRLGFVDRHADKIRVAGLLVLAAGLAVHIFGWWPDPTKVPEPRLLFIDHKSYQSPIRLIHFLALASVFSLAFLPILRTLPRAAEFLCLLGRNSLTVFCVGSIVSLFAQIFRYASGGTLAVDTLIVVIGVFLMYLSAWLAEWPQRARKAA